jgi:tubulin-specific chaperone D
VGLKDKDTIVRWSSAKGIGNLTLYLHIVNITNKNVFSLQDVLDLGYLEPSLMILWNTFWVYLIPLLKWLILVFFHLFRTPSLGVNSIVAWHGGCLGIAELARRGLLLPSRLEFTFSKIFDALQYDTPCGMI